MCRSDSGGSRCDMPSGEADEQREAVHQALDVVARVHELSSEEGESPGDQVQALSERGRVVNDFIWRDGPRRLDYFSCNQQGCRRSAR